MLLPAVLHCACRKRARSDDRMDCITSVVNIQTVPDTGDLRIMLHGISYACSRSVHFVNLNTFCARDTKYLS
jgi:hypothetical protein